MRRYTSADCDTYDDVINRLPFFLEEVYKPKALSFLDRLCLAGRV
jgi:hypothetical protein